ncbi:hypothetical protein SAMN04487975_105183 [Planococcus glaciei]|uniref:methylamine utilization protein MauJ n=1 Tax=Planococcus glaciei TaxID=459472 RepID=UPI00087EE9AF|nr:methylamine utilization protein MauJ [Planococcus glaciei]SDH54589.1 hypothetical protein SAMN04487975_105183 [Planococcus glaciei]
MGGLQVHFYLHEFLMQNSVQIRCKVLYFYFALHNSDIKIQKSTFGLKATITAYADSMESAETVAYVYFGRMKDILSLINDIPIQFHKYEGQNFRQQNFTSRRLLSKSDIISAFQMARKFEAEQPALLKAIGWYSKGKLSHNTFDQFFAFWSVIEILAKEFHTPTDRTKKGIKNQIYQSFLDYFGPMENWDFADSWLDLLNDKRNVIYHGGEYNSLDTINEISKLIPSLEETSKKLINCIIDSKYDRNSFIHFDF